ncbi:MAG: regulatory protein RecX [Bacteroidetes bacterium]|nr:regulatory protein RecX [Bacteroidota bacterium]
MSKRFEPVDSGMVLQKIKYFCSYQERCIRDIEAKLKDWTVQKKLIPDIILQLQKEGYLNEERYAKVYAGGKFRVNKWGRQKIEFELKLKGIPENTVHKGMEEIDEDDYQRVIRDLILKKQKEIKPGKDLNIREKIITFVQGKGYETDLILTALKELKI